MSNRSQIDRHDGPRGLRVYKIPLRAFPFLEANAYVVVDGAYTALIDVGSGTPDSNADLEAGFDALRTSWGETVSLATLSRVVVTHGHIDHYGGLDLVRRQSHAPVAIHGLDRGVIEDPRQHHEHVGGELQRFFGEAGLGLQEAVAALELYHGSFDGFQGMTADTILGDGDRLDDRFDVFHTPGHCAGQVCLQLEGWLFGADHVLPDTFPHLGPERSAPWTGLTHYLDALARIEQVPNVRLTLSGHGAPMAKLGERIAQLRASNERKLERVIEACAEPRTLLEITEAVYPRVQSFHALLALEKVGAYAEYLVQSGAVALVNGGDRSADDAHPWRYERSGDRGG